MLFQIILVSVENGILLSLAADLTKRFLKTAQIVKSK